MTSANTNQLLPTLKIVPMQNDFDSLLAAIATIAVRASPEDVKKVAVEHKLIPTHGPYWPGDDVLISKIFAQLGWVSTFWKEAKSVTELPLLALVLDDYNADTDVGRFVIFNRLSVTSQQKTDGAVILDPAYWLTPEQRVRRELQNLAKPIWYIGVSQMAKTTTK